MRPLRLGTRGSPLALAQAGAVADRIHLSGGPPCEVVPIKTAGDRLADASLSDVGGKRLFVREIEEELLHRRIDLAVHSSKDMPVELPEGLAIGAVLPREDPRDALILREQPSGRGGAGAPGGGGVPGEKPEDVCRLVALVGQSPRIGTSSVRRVAQLRRLLPEGRFEPARGNLESRLRKLDRGEYDVLALAAAGLRRLGLDSRISLHLPVSVCVPAPGQGALAVEIRGDDQPLRELMRRIDEASASAALEAERALVAALGGGCQTPIGAVAIPVMNVDSDNRRELELHAIVVSLDGAQAVRGQGRGRSSAARALGERVAQQLIEGGALDILREAQRTASGQWPVAGGQ